MFVKVIVAPNLVIALYLHCLPLKHKSIAFFIECLNLSSVCLYTGLKSQNWKLRRPFLCYLVYYLQQVVLFHYFAPARTF